MAEEDTQTQAAPDPSGLSPDMLDQLYRQLMTQQPVMPTGTPDDGTRPGWTGLLGSVLGGGQGPGYQLRGREAETAGNRALLNFGINTLLASGPSPIRSNPLSGALSAVATGLQGAQESLGLDQRRAGAQAATAYEQNRQQQQDQLARIKEAIPLLTLKQRMDAVKALPPTLSGGTPGGGGNIAEGGSVLTALAGIESGDQNIVSRVDKDSKGLTLAQGGNPAEISQGHFQIQPATWVEFAKQAGVDTTQYPTPMSAPRDVQAQVASVIPLARFGPRTQTMLRQQFGDLDSSKTIGALNGARPAATPSPPGRTAVAPPAPPGTAPPGAKVQIPPPTTAGGSALPPPEAPIAPGAGGAQVAGPGAPTSGVIPPSPSGSAADVADIVSGMVARGADPNTLAVGPVPPGPAGTATAGPPTAPPDPDSYEAHTLLHPITPGPVQQRLFNPQPDPDQLRAIAERKRQAELTYQGAKTSADPLATAQKAREMLDKANADEATLRENARKLGVETEAKWYEQQDKQRFDMWTAARADARQQANAAQAAKDKLAEIEATGRQQRESTAAGAVVESNKKIRDSLAEDSVKAAQTIPTFEGLLVLSENVPDGSADTLRKAASIQFGGTTLLNHLSSLGIVDPAKAGPIQALQSGISGAIAELRGGMPMGALSDRDLSFIESMGPQIYEDQGTRSAVISYILQAKRQRMRFNTEYNEEMTKPGMYPAKALENVRRTMDDKYPIVPQIPDRLFEHWTDPSPEWVNERAKWAKDQNVKMNTMVRQPDGHLLPIVKVRPVTGP